MACVVEPESSRLSAAVGSVMQSIGLLNDYDSSESAFKEPLDWRKTRANIMKHDPLKEKDIEAMYNETWQELREKIERQEPIWDAKLSHGLAEDDIRNHEQDVACIDCESVHAAVSLLNSLQGHEGCPEGRCLVWSARAKLWYLLYRVDKKDTAPTVSNTRGVLANGGTLGSSALSNQVSSGLANGEPIGSSSSSSKKSAAFTATICSSDPNEQESDLMERMGSGVFNGNPATAGVELVSLGCSCAPKLSFKDIGRGAETLPFDWSRTTVEALLSFIGNGFDGFFDTARNKIQYSDEEGTNWTAYRSPIHSFWHDDPTMPAMRERYTRRIQRFFNIDARSKPVLFVRSVAASSEIARAKDLCDLLMRKFGQKSHLLLIIDYQGPEALGPCIVPGLDNLLLWSFNTASATSGAAPYGQIVTKALNWAIGQQIGACPWPSLEEFQSILKPTDWGMYGAGKVPAFI